MKRIIGVVFLLIGLAGLAISVAGTLAGRQVVDEIGAGLQDALSLAAGGLDTVEDTLVVAKETVSQVQASMDTIVEAAANVSQSMNDTGPLIEQATQVATVEVPNSIDALQAVMPDVAEAAGAIDDTLTVLDKFEVDRVLFGVPIQFDLGVDYNPQVPLDVTVLELGASLEELPDSLRVMESNLTLANENLQTIGGNLQTISEDLEAVNVNLDEVDPLLDEYIRLASETSDLLREKESELDQQLELAKLVVTLFFVWIGLNQIIPLYLSWELLTGRRDDVKVDEARGDGA